MKKYVAPMSCVLSVKMDENIAYSGFKFPMGGEYIYDNGTGKIQNTPLSYSSAVANASNPAALFAVWAGDYKDQIFQLIDYLNVVATDCYIKAYNV